MTPSISSIKALLRRTYSGPWYKRVAVWLLTAVIAFLLLLGAVDVNFLWLFGRSPGFEQIKHPVQNEASEIYSSDSVLLGRFFSQNRTPVKYEEISPIIIRTLIATEDERFYHHHGVDFAGLVAAAKDMTKGHARGASTITQQLAKNLFRVRTQYSTGLFGHIPGLKILVMKAKEWIVATKLEMAFSKEEILTWYFNTVDFGQNSFGIQTAARTYFGTTPDRLNYEQSATLVGLLKATSSYNPRRHPEASKKRRNVVLQNLFDHGGIIINGYRANAHQLDSLQALPIQCVDHVEESSYDGLAPYFRTGLQDYIDMLWEKGLIGTQDNERLDLYADGLKIYTTIDSRMQRYAEEAALRQMRTLQQRFDDHWLGQNPWQDQNHREIPEFIENIARRTEHYKYLAQRFPDEPDSVTFYLNQPHRVKLFSYDGPIYRDVSTLDSIRYMVSFLHCGFLAIEPDTRFVRAWVGDISFDFWKYDKVTSKRQPGSTFKLFVYTEAMNKGMKPCDLRTDQWFSYNDTISGRTRQWAPHNANGYYSGAVMSLKLAFAQSINSIAAKLGQEVGIHNVATTAHKMGIQSKLDEVPALSLGASDVSLLELVNSYCTVIADGKYNMPLMISRIEDRDGEVIYEAKLNEQQAIPYRSAFFMQQMLKGGLTQPGGTTQALWQYIHPVQNKTEFGGKTGTSNNHSDAWFVGVTPKLVAGGWVGGEYRSIHFRTGALGQGSRTALPIFGNFIARVLQDQRLEGRYAVKFQPPREEIFRGDYECAVSIEPPAYDIDSIANLGPMEGISFDGETLTGTREEPQVDEEAPTTDTQEE
ncbi:MAG: transglycosylase domain-containing protein [Bacteroidaceae bacterium]|nr:transglycosylase domain-containing protein [Bacteroidaceae bacterium]